MCPKIQLLAIFVGGYTWDFFIFLENFWFYIGGLRAGPFHGFCLTTVFCSPFFRAKRETLKNECKTMFLPGKSMKTMHFQCISLKFQDFHEISMKMYAFTRYFLQKIRFSIDFHMNFKICMKFKWKSMFSPHISLKKHDFPWIFIEMLRFPWKFNENACFHYIFQWKNMIFNRFSLKNRTCPRFFSWKSTLRLHFA